MQQIGRYQILGELGRGAMGVVYRAKDPAINRTIAIKTIRLAALTDPGERERLRDRLFREAQSAGILSHPNIVTIYDILEENGLAYIFMEMVNGPSLEKLLESETAPDKETLNAVLRQTAGALDYAHRKGIVHRDIKPANIMIHDDGIAKITDFGVAKILSQQMTQSGMMMGTPSYMSPEQVQGTEVSGRADQFALAVVAYEMFTGEKPFTAEYLPSLLYKICREDPVGPQRLNPTLAADVEGVFRKALAKNPSDRYPTCLDFVAELDRASSACPDWVPLVRGTSHNAPTGSPVAPAGVNAGPPTDSAQTVAEWNRADTDETVAAPVAPSANDPAPRPEPPLLRVHQRLEETENHMVRNVVLAFMAVILAVAGILVYQRLSTPEPVQVAENSPIVPEVDKPSPTTPHNRPSSSAQSKTQPDDGASRNASPPVSPDSEEEQEPDAALEVPQPPPMPARTPAGEDVITRIISSPPGARVIVDGDPSLTCVSPCSVPLPPGRHTALARLPGYRDRNRIFEIPRDAQLSMDMEQQAGTLSIVSSPAGATILINGSPRAERTPAVFRLPAGSYRLQVVSGNIRSDEEIVVIRDGGMSTRRYTLE